jgi:hypothetical protein
MATRAPVSAEIISRAILPYSLYNILPLPSLAGATLISYIGKMNTIVLFQDDHHGSHLPQHALLHWIEPNARGRILLLCLP